MQQGSDILARPGSHPCRKRRNPSSLRGHSSTPSSRGYHLALSASMTVPKTQWNLGRRHTSGPVGHIVGFRLPVGQGRAVGNCAWLSVAAKKGTKMAAKWWPTRRAVRSEPSPLLRSVVKNGPEPSWARRCWARRSEPLTARTVLRRSLKRERRGERLAKRGPPKWYPRPPPLTPLRRLVREESCLIQDEPGEGTVSHNKMSLEERTRMLGIDHQRAGIGTMEPGADSGVSERQWRGRIQGAESGGGIRLGEPDAAAATV